MMSFPPALVEYFLAAATLLNVFAFFPVPTFIVILRAIIEPPLTVDDALATYPDG